MSPAAVTSGRCSRNHSGGAGQVRGTAGTTMLGPAAHTATMSSTETTMAAAAAHPRNPERLAGAAAWRGRRTRVAAAPAGTGVKSVRLSCPLPYPTTLRTRVDELEKIPTAEITRRPEWPRTRG